MNFGKFFLKLSIQKFAFAVLWLSTLTMATAEVFPEKPIRMVVPFSAGGGTDMSSRVIAEEMGKLLGVPIIVENKPGASGIIAVNSVLSAPADGYTILIATNSLVSVNPVVMNNLPYDPFKDLMPLHGITVSPPVISAGIDSPYSSLKEALLDAKENGKSLSFGNYSHGYELLASWVGALENIEIVHVPYKGPSNMLTDLVGGRIDFAISDPASALQLINTGKLKGMAVASDKRDNTMPEIPTMKELGYDEYESYVWASVFAKSGTPPEISKILANAIGKANLSDAQMKLREGQPGQPLSLALEKMGEFQLTEYNRFKTVAEKTNFVKK